MLTSIINEWLDGCTSTGECLALIINENASPLDKLNAIAAVSLELQKQEQAETDSRPTEYIYF